MNKTRREFLHRGAGTHRSNLAQGHRRRGPRAANDHLRAGRVSERTGPGDGLRHRHGVRGNGAAGAVVGPRGPARAADADRRWLHQRGQARDGGGRRRRGFDDVAVEVRDPAQPCADVRRSAGVGPHRSVREHRTWMQLRNRRQTGARVCRLRTDRGGVRRRPWVRKVHAHQGAVQRPGAERRCTGRVGTSAEVARRRQGSRSRNAQRRRRP